METSDWEAFFVFFITIYLQSYFCTESKVFFPSNKDKLAVMDSTTPLPSSIKCTLKIMTWKFLPSLSFEGLCTFHSNSWQYICSASICLSIMDLITIPPLQAHLVLWGLSWMISHTFSSFFLFKIKPPLLFSLVSTQVYKYC